MLDIKGNFLAIGTSAPALQHTQSISFLRTESLSDRLLFNSQPMRSFERRLCMHIQKHNSKKKNEASVGDKNIERLNFITKIFIASAILGKQQHSPVFILERSYCTADNEFIVLCIEHFGAFVFIKTKHMNLSLIPLCFGVYVDSQFCLLS